MPFPMLKNGDTEANEGDIVDKLLMGPDPIA